MQTKLWFRQFCVTGILIGGLIPGLHAQIKMVRPIDIAGFWKGGKAHVEVVPAFSGDTLKPFDGNQFNAMEFVNTDSITITLQFDSTARFEKSKVFFWHGAQWTLESASILSDLDSKTGSYNKSVDARSASMFQWDSASFVPQNAHFVRLRVKNPSDSSVRLGEWTLEGTVTFTKYIILPQAIQLIPSTSLQLKVRISDDQGNIYSNFLNQPLKWKSDNSAVALVDEDGKVTGVQIGAASVTVANSAGTLSGSSPVSVVQDFRSEKVKPMTIKVVLVNQDPTLQSGNRLHVEFGWRDPNALADRLVVHFREATDSVVNFQILERVQATRLFTRYYGNFLSVPTYVSLLKEPGWASLKKASDSGQIYFDYREFVKYYGYDTLRNKGEIDEVWVFSAPYLGMYESQLLGPKAFWWNSPPIKDGTALTKLLSVMGLNFERGVDQAFHSFGHRVESAMVQAYSQAQGRSWNPQSIDPTPWDLFTRIDKDMPGQAHVGNVHFPPNGAHDYDYGNSTLVKSFAENWYRYPYLLDQSRQVNIATWYYSQGDPLAEGNDHLGYLRWWYGHLPRYVGVTDGVLNNWWHYALDYEAAVELAKKTPVIGVIERLSDPYPRSYKLEQNFPNPFNPTTRFQFTIPDWRFVTLKVYDLLGKETTVLVNSELHPGSYTVQWNAEKFSSGAYFYRLQAGTFAETKKLLLLK